jgi:hypothetical protein
MFRLLTVKMMKELWKSRGVMLWAGLLMVLTLLGLLLVAKRMTRNSVECANNTVSFEANAVGIREPGAELVLRIVPVDAHDPGPIRLTLAKGLSTKKFFFSPYSPQRVDCSRTLESVEIVVEYNGSVESKVKLVYPQDFYRDERGDYFARRPVIVGR